MTEIEIGGQRWPMRASIGAWKTFKVSTGKSFVDLDDQTNPDPELFATLAYYFIVSGCKHNKTEFDLSVDEFLDLVTIADMNKIGEAIAAEMGASQKKTRR